MPLDLNDDVIKNVRALIWKQEHDKILFLLTEELSGNFSIPGGCKDVEDADLQVTLRRELQEELGLNPEDYSAKDPGKRKEYENLYDLDPAFERFGKKTIVSIYLVSNLKKKPKPNNEIKSIIWTTKEDALKLFNRSHMKEIFQLAVKEIKK